MGVTMAKTTYALHRDWIIALLRVMIDRCETDERLWAESEGTARLSRQDLRQIFDQGPLTGPDLAPARPGRKPVKIFFQVFRPSIRAHPRPTLPARVPFVRFG